MTVAGFCICQERGDVNGLNRIQIMVAIPSSNGINFPIASFRSKEVSVVEYTQDRAVEATIFLYDLF